MKVGQIFYATNFVKELRRLDKDAVAIAIKKEKLFRENPLHPSLRLHGLKGKLDGLWSITVSGGVRIIFERQDNGDILFISIGHHDIYRNL